MQIGQLRIRSDAGEQFLDAQTGEEVRLRRQAQFNAAAGLRRAADGAEIDMRVSRSLGYKAKAIVNGQFVDVVNRALTPTREEVKLANKLIKAFDEARVAAGEKRIPGAIVDGFLVEVPDYLAARRLIARAAQFGIS